jgi:hypothetical protein
MIKLDKNYLEITRCRKSNGETFLRMVKRKPEKQKPLNVRYLVAGRSLGLWNEGRWHR